jgi:tRNA nucleotidyltransferase (CCA-adding enzyme)
MDLDVTVEGDGVQLANAIAQAFGGMVEPHPPFGTATVVVAHPWPRLRIDVATCRKETYVKPAAYPKVAAGTLQDDLARRDFTINAMAMALAPRTFGRLIDPFQGARDLRQKRLRMLHPGSFVDDPSRILRGIRFAQRFGLRWERGTQRAMREAVAAGALGWLNAGRLRKERELMTQEPNPRACARELEALSHDAAKGPRA